MKEFVNINHFLLHVLPKCSRDLATFKCLKNMKALIHIFYLLSINHEILYSISFIIIENTLGQADSLKRNKTLISKKQQPTNDFISQKSSNKVSTNTNKIQNILTKSIKPCFSYRMHKIGKKKRRRKIEKKPRRKPIRSFVGNFLKILSM